MKQLVTYTMAKTKDIDKLNAKMMQLCYKKFLNLYQTIKKW